MKVLIILICLMANALAQQCLPDVERVDCHPDRDASYETCMSRGCLWCDASVPDQNVPMCHFPRDYGYTMVGEPNTTTNGFSVELSRATTNTLFGGDSSTVFLVAEYQSNYRLRIKITDDTPRWEVPLQIDPPENDGAEDPLYEVFFSNTPTFSFKVVRKNTGTVLMDTSLGGFTFSDQFIQLGIKLPSRNVYGIGENEQPSYRHSFDMYPRWTLWAKDQPPDGHANMYGVQPHYTVLENDGNAHAVVIVNSNAQEFEMHPNPGIVYRTIGGILDIYIFLGPTPENTVQQYTEAVGRFKLPPYWSLGFQLCKYGYDSLEKMKEVVDRMIAAEIPLDVQYGDIDIMDRELDFTISPDRFAGLPEFVQEIKAKGIKFMTILDPCISTGEPEGSYRPFELGQEMDIWVKKPDGTPVLGEVWPDDPVYFPDYSKNSTREWWITLIKEFHEVLEFDALWIDMNEPANFIDGAMNEGCPQNTLNNPPYLPRVSTDNLYGKTICPDHVDSMGAHYNTHSLFGWAESEPTIAATTAAVGKRTFALSRSTYLGSGRWLTHWLGDNWSQWSDLYFSIIAMLQFNLFGMPFNGPDICGHIGNTTTEMCQRWQELGAFYPFSRNHNAKGNMDQDPAAFDGAIVESTKKALEVRYTLLPYLYTLLAQHNAHGNTVARAMWHEFPIDLETAGIDRQFMWGKGVLITPVLDEGQTNVRGYFPDARFYDYYNGTEVPTRGGYMELAAPLDHINVHIRGGVIIPTQEPAVNTVLSRQNPLGLIVALDDNYVASGRYYDDSGDSIDPIENGLYLELEISAVSGLLNVTVVHDGYPEAADKAFSTIRLLGAQSVTSVKVNGEAHTDFTVDPDSKEVNIVNLNLAPNTPFIVEYS